MEKKRNKLGLYRCSEKDTLEEVSILEEKVSGKTIKQHLEESDKMKKEIKELKGEVMRRRGEEKLLLDRAGVPRFDLVQIINPNKNYAIIRVDENNIIQKIATINNSSIIVEFENIPHDATHGYYRYNQKTKKIELDSELKEILYDL